MVNDKDKDRASKVKNDIILAQKICRKLCAGNNKAILDLYDRYNSFFMNFSRRRLLNPDRAEDVLTNFWKELLNSKAICAYKGENNVSLRNFLSGILKWRLINENNKTKKERERYSNNGRAGDSTGQEFRSGRQEQEPSAEEQLIKKEKQRFMHEALLMLEKVSPRDVSLIRMYCKGLTYREMAEQELAGNTDQQIIEKKTGAIKRQFTREKSGSMAKFRIIIERLMKDYGWDVDDLIN